MSRPVALVAFLALSWSHAAGLRCDMGAGALAMDESIAIVQPYDQFGAEESLHDRANRAIGTMRGRAERLAETIAAL